MLAATRMRFKIEIVRESGEVLYRTVVDEISPRRAKTKAAALLQSYGSRGAANARVSNDRGEELYKL